MTNTLAFIHVSSTVTTFINLNIPIIKVEIPGTIPNPLGAKAENFAYQLLRGSSKVSKQGKSPKNTISDKKKSHIFCILLKYRSIGLCQIKYSTGVI